jgi:hypothetical protein
MSTAGDAAVVDDDDIDEHAATTAAAIRAPLATTALCLDTTAIVSSGLGAGIARVI